MLEHPLCYTKTTPQKRLHWSTVGVTVTNHPETDWLCQVYLDIFLSHAIVQHYHRAEDGQEQGDCCNTIPWAINACNARPVWIVELMDFTIWPWETQICGSHVMSSWVAFTYGALNIGSIILNIEMIPPDAGYNARLDNRCLPLIIPPTVQFNSFTKKHISLRAFFQQLPNNLPTTSHPHVVKPPSCCLLKCDSNAPCCQQCAVSAMPKPNRSLNKGEP